MKYDWLVDRNADPSLIRMRFEGVDGLVLADGTLRVKTSAGDVIERRPVAWQLVHGSKVDVPVEYRLKDHVLSYVLPAGHDPKHPLVIDPVVVFCSFSGSSAANYGTTATYDEGFLAFAAARVRREPLIGEPSATDAGLRWVVVARAGAPA